MPKMPRLSREVVVTEKLDGTNASVYIFPQPCEGTPGSAQSLAEWEEAKKKAVAVLDDVPTLVLAGSRTRWVTPGKDDNYGWAAWVKENAAELAKLGPGHHFGEWWGKGIQRGYGLSERRFSLFNAGRWAPVPSNRCNDNPLPEGLDMAPMCCHVVPVMYRGPFHTILVDQELSRLELEGSVAAKGFMDPEGVVVYHTAASFCFKKTIKGDDHGKSHEAHVKKVREPQAHKPKDPNVGGRRKALTIGYQGPERRKQK